jgi:hypothetical protein
MSNNTIREQAKKSRVKLWRVAECLGIADSVLSRKLRHELPETERDHILQIIKTLAEEG